MNKSTRQGDGRWKLLWSFMRPRAPILALALLLGLFVSGMELASPLATRWVLDSLKTGTSIGGAVLLLVGLLVLGSAVAWWQWMILGTLAENVVYGARESMLRRYLNARLVPLLRFSPGELVTRVTSDSVLLREAASSSVIGIINSSVALIGTLVLMAVLDLPLAALTFAVVALVGLVVGALMPAIGGMQERAQSALGDLGGELEGTLRAIKTVKTANAENEQLSGLLNGAQRSRDHGIRAVRREALVWTITGAGVQAAIISVLAVGAWRVSINEMSVPTLVAFLLYVFGLLGPVTELSNHLTSLQAGLAAAARIREVEAVDLEPKGDAFSRSDDVAGAPVLQMDGVTARYAADRPAVVRELNLVVPARGHTALVGLSGAGKTSVFSLILRFLEPESGHLRLHGVPFERLSPADVRSHLAYVEQEAPLLPGSLDHNLRFGNPDVTESEIMAVLTRLHLDDMVATMPDGIHSELHNTSISGGQRQRIAVARAILGKPNLLLLDEATAQVDGLSEEAVHDAIRDYASRGAVLTIAHRLSTVFDADNIIVMESGQAVAQGTHSQLMQHSDLYQRMVRSFTPPPKEPTSPKVAQPA